MLRRIPVLSLAIILLSFTPPVHAGDWEDFQGFLDRYYFIDDHDFEEITCAVKVETLDQMVGRLKEQFTGVPGAVMEENVSDFGLTLRKGSGVTFRKPGLSLYLPPDRDLARNERKQQGVKMIEDGFGMSVEGTVMILEGLFEYFVRPREPRFTLQAFSMDQGKADFTYTVDGRTFTARCEGDRCVRNFSEKGTTVKDVETYDVVDGEYFLSSTQAVYSDSMSTIETTLNIGYTTVQNIPVPYTITGTSQMRSMGTNMEGVTNITLRDCRVR